LWPQKGHAEIPRENGWRRLIVGLNIKQYRIRHVCGPIASQSRPGSQHPPVISGYGGLWRTSAGAMRHLSVGIPLSLFIIIGLMYQNFGQMRFAVMIL
jgi:cobalt-zinc-cadmium resistance protein CzcA